VGCVLLFLLWFRSAGLACVGGRGGGGAAAARRVKDVAFFTERGGEEKRDAAACGFDALTGSPVVSEGFFFG
jgi:hypothetical protein